MTRWLALAPMLLAMLWNARPIAEHVKRVLINREIIKVIAWFLELLSNLNDWINRILA